MTAKRLFATLFILLISSALYASEPEMADVMRSNGKIYVVVAVLATIFAGIFIYLFILDRKITKLEKTTK